MSNEYKGPAERYGINHTNRAGTTDTIPEDVRLAHIHNLAEQLKKIPSEDFEFLVMCGKVKGEERVVVALGGRADELKAAIASLIQEAENNGLFD